jgi:foldase protein PrsA
VSRTTRRASTAVAACVTAAVVLTGCGNTPVRSGAAATVGDVRISTAELAGLVDRGLKDPQAQQQNPDKSKFQRETLARLIEHQVLVEAARQQHVSATSGATDAQLAALETQAGGHAQLVQAAAQHGIAERDLRDYVADLALREALSDALTADIDVPAAQLDAAYKQSIAQFDQVHAAHILVSTKAQADSILAQVKSDPTQFDALAARYSTDTSNKDKGGDLGFAGRGSFVKEFDTAVFSAKPGSFLEVKTQFGFHVVHVIERRTTTPAQAAPELRRAVLSPQRQQRLDDLLAKVAKGLHVKVNPRFGRWDPAQGVVEASHADAVSSPAPSPGESQDAQQLTGQPGQQPGQPGQQPGQQAPGGTSP